METRFVPDAAGAWLVYDLGTRVLAVPSELRAAADAVVAGPAIGLAATVDALRSSGVADAAPFAVLDVTAGELSLVLRGPATVAVGDVTLTGLGADPWFESRLPDVAVARLTVPGGEWTFAFPPAPVSRPTPVIATPVIATPAVVAPPPPLLEPRSEITEVPELSVPVPVAAPDAPDAPDEAGEADDRTVALEDRPRRPAAPADDATVVVDEIARLRATRSAGLADPVAPAVVAPAPAPALSLELPDGSREPLDAVVLVGRAPAAPADGAARLVRLADGDISRNHARIAVEGGTVVVTDLGSRNGTIVRIPGRPAQKLRGGEPTPVLVGTVIDFGGGVELRVREG